MSVISIKDHSGLDNTEKKHLENAVAWILSDSSFAQHVLFDRNAPGNEYTTYGCNFKSPFIEFRHLGAGIGGMAGKTCISWLAGKVDGETVIFIHPTSNLVDYAEVKNVLRGLKDMPIISPERIVPDLQRLLK